MRKGEIICNKQFLFFSQCFLPYMALIFHFNMSSVICFNLDQSKILLSGNWLMQIDRFHCLLHVSASVFTKLFLRMFFLLFSRIFCRNSEAFECNTTSDWQNRTVWFSESDIVLHSKLQILVKKTKEDVLENGW